MTLDHPLTHDANPISSIGVDSANALTPTSVPIRYLSIYPGYSVQGQE